MRPTRQHLLATSCLRALPCLTNASFISSPVGRGYVTVRDERVRYACLPTLDGCGRQPGQEAEDHAAIGRYRRAYGRVHCEPLATKACGDQQQWRALAGKSGCAKCSKCSKCLPLPDLVQIERIEQREGSAATPLAAPGIGTPKEWRERLREVLSTPCPSDMPGDRWECACRGIEQFARAWAAKAMSLGWTFDELFAFEEPFANVSLLGAARFIGTQR